MALALGQGQGRIQTSEATTDDDDVLGLFPLPFHGVTITTSTGSLKGDDGEMVSLPLTASISPEGSAAGLDAAPPELPRDRHGSAIDLGVARSELEPLNAIGRMRWAQEAFAGHFAVTTSFGIQSAVMLHMVSALDGSGAWPAIPVLLVDTGYLPP